MITKYKQKNGTKITSDEQNLKRKQNLKIDATKDKIKQSHEEEHKNLRV